MLSVVEDVAGPVDPVAVLVSATSANHGDVVLPTASALRAV